MTFTDPKPKKQHLVFLLRASSIIHFANAPTEGWNMSHNYTKNIFILLLWWQCDVSVLEVFSSPLFSVSSGLKSPLSVSLKASSWSSVNKNIYDIWSNNHAHWKALKLHLTTHLSSEFMGFSSAGIQIQAEENGQSRGHTPWLWRFRLFVKTWPCYWIMPKLGDTCWNFTHQNWSSASSDALLVQWLTAAILQVTWCH